MVPQVVDGWVPQVGNGVVLQVVDGVGVVPQVGDSVAPQVVDIAVGRSGSCSSCGSVSAIWRTTMEMKRVEGRYLSFMHLLYHRAD